jgi:hypothetical protein
MIWKIECRPSEQLQNFPYWGSGTENQLSFPLTVPTLQGWLTCLTWSHYHSGICMAFPFILPWTTLSAVAESLIFLVGHLCLAVVYVRLPLGMSIHSNLILGGPVSWTVRSEWRPSVGLFPEALTSPLLKSWLLVRRLLVAASLCFCLFCKYCGLSRPLFDESFMYFT